MWIKKKDICAECGCFIPAKLRVVLESCPLDKWSQDKEGWEEALKRLSEKIDKDNYTGTTPLQRGFLCYTIFIYKNDYDS